MVEGSNLFPSGRTILRTNTGDNMPQTRGSRISTSQFLLLGVHYTTANLNIRESFTFHEVDREHAIRTLCENPLKTGICSLVILTTCNRVELYAYCDQVALAEQSIRHYLIEHKGITQQVLESEAIHSHTGDGVARHLYKVACGLDSQILGEGQILGQVKEAFEAAQRLHPIIKPLEVLFKEAIHVGKRVRHETGITMRDENVSKAAVALARQHMPDFAHKRILVVGGGKMATLLIEALLEDEQPHPKTQLALMNRSEARVQELATQYNVPSHPWEALPQLSQWADVWFVATGAPHLLFFAEHFTGADIPEAIYDIAVPRNVCPQLQLTHPHIKVYDMDSLDALEGHNPQRDMQLRKEAAVIVKQALEHLPRCLNKVACKQELTQFREFMEQLHTDYVTEHPPIVSSEFTLEEQNEKLVQWSHGLLQRILHSPSHVINEGLYNASQLTLLNELFTPAAYSRQPIHDFLQPQMEPPSPHDVKQSLIAEDNT
jgi:glutamyl-tRNA reductase